MATEDVALDDKAKRMRDLLASFYAPDPSASAKTSPKFASLDAINAASFDADQYMNLLVHILFRLFMFVSSLRFRWDISLCVLIVN